jgi:DNA-directed RNA polymerase subunit M/transcription elongation factor TFIIS
MLTYFMNASSTGRAISQVRWELNRPTADVFIYENPAAAPRTYRYCASEEHPHPASQFRQVCAECLQPMTDDSSTPICPSCLREQARLRQEQTRRRG